MNDADFGRTQIRLSSYFVDTTLARSLEPPVHFVLHKPDFCANLRLGCRRDALWLPGAGLCGGACKESDSAITSRNMPACSISAAILETWTTAGLRSTLSGRRTSYRTWRRRCAADLVGPMCVVLKSKRPACNNTG